MSLVSFNDSNITIGSRIHKCRTSWNMTQEELAEVIDVTPNYIGEIERGRRPLTLSVAEQLCLYFGVTYDYLYLGIERPAEQLLRDGAPDEKKKKSRKDLLLSFVASSTEEDCRNYLALLSEMRKILNRQNRRK
ncbi:MAG: helix-turn-helix transcriptional regulator [Lachnospiraceae bacterium]|nr:helix-turn-helix transcriptional regulator [Lachnospiraceae bacterium]